MSATAETMTISVGAGVGPHDVQAKIRRPVLFRRYERDVPGRRNPPSPEAIERLGVGYWNRNNFPVPGPVWLSDPLFYAAYRIGTVGTALCIRGLAVPDDDPDVLAYLRRYGFSVLAAHVPRREGRIAMGIWWRNITPPGAGAYDARHRPDEAYASEPGRFGLVLPAGPAPRS